MIKRPKPGEDEDEILKMQEEFLREKDNPSLQPAAQVVNLRPVKRTCASTAAESSTRKPSKYAQAKGLKDASDKRSKTESCSGFLMGDILEKNIDKPTRESLPEEDDKVCFPSVIPSLLGNIVEKNVGNFDDLEYKPMPSKGFPEVAKWNPDLIRDRISNKDNVPVKMDVDEPSTSKISSYDQIDPINLPTKSYIVSSSDADDIHKENVERLKKMTEEDILKEQQKLIVNLDPKLVEFLKSRRAKAKNDEKQTDKLVDVNKIEEENIYDDTLWENDVLSHPEVSNWLHFSSLEEDKLEWIKAFETMKSVDPDKQYEARFDFRGYLLPYTMDYTEETKTLFHHGEEPHRPGYTLTELIELSRSAVIQQRVMALNTIAGILEYYNVGTYKNVMEIPISKIFFIIRIAMDENKVIVLEPALKAMRNLLYNRIDEACLDALIGFDEGFFQPCLENDKSEIEELDSTEPELKDFHLAEIDIITALIRTDVLQRIYYILDTIKPNFNCVQYSLQILIRLARDSIATVKKIVEFESLMKTIIHNFIPITSINFVFDANITYKGKPILAALKLFRVISLHSEEMCKTLFYKYNILQPIVEYINSTVDRSYGLRIQIEAFAIFSNLLQYNLGNDEAAELTPILATLIHQHIQTSVSHSSVLLATHAAMLLQFINKSQICNFNCSGKDFLCELVQKTVRMWLLQFSQAENYTCGHLRLVCSTLNMCKSMLLSSNLSLHSECENLIKSLLKTNCIEQLIANLLLCSNLLSGLENKDLHLTKNLMSLGTSVIDSKEKILPILYPTSPFPFWVSLLKVIENTNDKGISTIFLSGLLPYIKRISRSVPHLCDNWFTRIETDFLLSFVKLSTQLDIDEEWKDLLYVLANKLCYILRADKKNDLEYLFDNIIFNKDWFTPERMFTLLDLNESSGFSKALTDIQDIRWCYRKVINLSVDNVSPSVLLLKWREPILPRDWIYLPILSLYSKSQDNETRPKVVGEHSINVIAKMAEEKEMIVTCSLEWILCYELCFPDLLKDIHVTDRFCRVLCVFICDNNLFLEPKIKILLRKYIEVLFRRKQAFNFDVKLAGVNNFQGFYTQLLEQFQAVSYGDHNFAACVLVPLAQKHNVKWRKLIWSEYAGCLRALDCPENMLCYEIGDYLYPLETDKSLLKSYFEALNNNMLRLGTIPYKIAKHHSDHFKKNIT